MMRLQTTRTCPERRCQRPRRQQGATLMVGLIMLLVLTLLVVSGIRSSNANLKIVGNMQARDEAAAAAQQAVEEVMSDVNNFYTPAARTTTVDINNDGSADYTVTIAAPVCLKLVTVDGYSVEFADSAPKESYWDIAVQVADTRTGATATVHQGAQVRLDATATCPG
jgi:Tfp pilus assembly protein PilX